MSSAIGPGDWVRCVQWRNEGCGPHYELADSITVGAIYQIEDVFPGENFPDGMPGVTLVQRQQLGPDGRRFAYDLRCFEPIWRPDDTIIESLKAPAPDAVRELIAAD